MDQSKKIWVKQRLQLSPRLREQEATVLVSTLVPFDERVIDIDQVRLAHSLPIEHKTA